MKNIKTVSMLRRSSSNFNITLNNVIDESLEEELIKDCSKYQYLRIIVKVKV